MGRRREVGSLRCLAALLVVLTPCVVSGGDASLSDPDVKNRLVESEQALILPFVFRT